MLVNMVERQENECLVAPGYQDTRYHDNGYHGNGYQGKDNHMSDVAGKLESKTDHVSNQCNEKVSISDSLLVPPPPVPFYKIEEKFVFDDVASADNSSDTLAPVDKYNFYFISFMVLGAGFHLPFNSFVAAVDYFMLVYNRPNMTFIVAATYTYTTCLAVMCNVFLVNKVSTHRRISFGYLAFMISLMSMAVLVLLTMYGLVDVNTGFMITVIATFFTGIGCGVQEASYYGYAGMLPSKYTRAIMLGESFAGLIVSVNRIITKVTIESPIMNTTIFFSLSIVGEIVCIFLHKYIKRSPFIRYYKKESSDQQLFLSACSAASTEDDSNIPSPDTFRKPTTVYDNIKEGIKVRLTISKNIWKLMLGILQVYFVSLLLYPGVASIIPSSWPNGWLPVVMITAFNLSDFVGTLATGIRWKMSENLLLILGVLRWLLIPVLLLCVVPLEQPLISGELVPLLVINILGFTTGYMGSTPMCAATTKVPLEHREMSGNLMTMMMLMGLTLGATFALGLNPLLGIVGAEW